MKKLLCLLFLSSIIFSCNNDDVTEQKLSSSHDSSLKSSSIKPRSLTAKSSSTNYSLFKVTEQYHSGTEAGIIGEIYCSRAMLATFQFGYHGNVATKYELRMPSTPLITSAVGPSVRTITAQLHPGINRFAVCVKFSGPEQYANARLSLISIDNDTTLDAEGYTDLTAEGHSETKAVDGSTSPMHVKCSRCGFLNSKIALKCSSCGK
jgi:hypothetical protein